MTYLPDIGKMAERHGIFLNKQLGKLQNKNTCIKLLKVNTEHMTDTKEIAEQI